MRFKFDFLSFAKNIGKNILQNYCVGCALPAEKIFCQDCISRSPMPASVTFDLGADKKLKIVSAIPYSNLTSPLIKAKFFNKPGFFERAGVDLLAERISLNEGIVCHVPSHWSRRFIRGFDQAEILAKSFAKKKHLVYCPLLVRKRATSKQSFQESLENRKKNVKDAFCVDPKIFQDSALLARFDGGQQTIVIVDDLLTTGATIVTAAKALSKTFPKIKAINGLCLARTL